MSAGTPTVSSPVRGESLRAGREEWEMIRRILAVIAIVVGVLLLFVAHPLSISTIHWLSGAVVVLGIALVLE
jgi:hypothetical protein